LLNQFTIKSLLLNNIKQYKSCSPDLLSSSCWNKIC